MRTGSCGQVLRPLGAGDDERDAAVALLAAVELAQDRLDDPARGLVVFDGDRAVVEPRAGLVAACFRGSRRSARSPRW